MDRHGFDASEFLAFDRMHRIHRETELVVDVTLDQEDDRSDDDRNNGDRRTEVVVTACFREIGVIDDDRESLITFTDQ